MGRELPFRMRRYIRLVLVALCAVGIGLYFLTDAAWARWTMIAALAIYVVFHMALWRCPVCGKPIGSSILPPRSCYNCGESFED